MKYKPFGLSTYKINKIRCRTINGYKFFYYCHYKPEGLTHLERLNTIKSFKYPTSSFELDIRNEMIRNAVESFDVCVNAKNFDVVLTLPSSSDAVDEIFKQLKPKLKADVYVETNAFKKTRIRNVKLLSWQINKENSLKTKIKVSECYNKIRETCYDKVSRMHYYPTRFRRYVTNFFSWNKDLNLDGLVDKNILIIDDTFGEGITLREIMWMLDIGVGKQLYNKMVYGFTVMKDYC